MLYCYCEESLPGEYGPQIVETVEKNLFVGGKPIKLRLLDQIVETVEKNLFVGGKPIKLSLLDPR